MIDIASQLKAIHREVGRLSTTSGEVVEVLVRRQYEAPVEDVWDAVTDPERLRRWFLPVSGDLRPGGSFQLEGNAGGEILVCEAPNRLRVTFGSATSIVELRLAADGDATVLELAHTVPIELAGSGAGSLYVGPGWDGAVMGLGLFLAGHVVEDPVAAANSLETQEFSRGSVHEWAAVVDSSGTATAEEITAATEVSLAQFAPDLTKPEGDRPS
ncbi:SRPBCC family protein [Saccharopolyspora erythraea]|uniref:SRPBCC family protein n=1 Tax=Saccharopolyspora erythraea TaxID=1836 RepID=UPI001BA90803|nr:SRPBCC family protein [Saccharopolyspora erythraea]QUH02623.1 SRPBCC family protein [Saccharopolyspora erythraea]